MDENFEDLNVKSEVYKIDGIIDTDDKYRNPEPDEIKTRLSVGTRLNIYWNGDKRYYPCKIVGFNDKKHHIYNVLYEEDDSGIQYNEDLNKTKFKIWAGTNEEYEEERKLAKQQKNFSISETIQSSKTNHLSNRVSYQTMVIEAVINLADRHGSSIMAIRKYIQSNYSLKLQQTASFNSLTLKALQKCVALDILDLEKRVYRLSEKEKAVRKDRDKAIRAAALAASREASVRELTNNMRYKKSLQKSLSGKSNSSIAALASGGDPLLLSFYGTAAASNKTLRKELLKMRTRRDKFLDTRFKILKPFLLQKNYFSKKTTKELSTVLADKESRKRLDSKEMCGESFITDNMTINNADVNIVDIEQEEPVVAVVAAATSTIDKEQNLNTDENKGEYVDDASTTAQDINIINDIIDIETSNTVDNIESVCESKEVDNIEEARDDEIEMEEEEVQETSQRASAYSTMNGVKILNQPSILKAELHEHQIQGISWMVHMFQNGMPMILGDQMGLGKTIQSIGFLAYLHHNLNKKGPYMVVVPLSVLSNWISEIERFCPSFRAVRFHGPKSERNRIKEEELNDLREFDIVVTTYEILVSEVNFFRRKYVWTAIIIDEGHRLKNDRSQFSEKLRTITCLSKVILTGTPLQNNLKELWAMLLYLSPDIFVSSKPFEEGFDLAKGQIDSTILRKARKLLSVFMLRRLKENVAIKLPSRRELTVLVPLTLQQHTLYKQMLCSLDSDTIEVVMHDSGSNNMNPEPTENISQEVNDPMKVKIGQDVDWRKLMNLLLQLRKICNHTYLLPDVAPEPYETTEDIVKGSGKLLMLDRMLPILQTEGHRVLIFSQFTSMLDLLEEYCELRGYHFVRLDGETNRVKRRLDVRRFNDSKSSLFIFLISTRAGGLASADTVILYDSDWNPQVDLQAMERAHRIGQTKPVRVYRLVCRGSVEERMVSRAEKKLFLNAMVAEVDPDEHLHEVEGYASGDEAENLNDAKRQAEISEALGIGGTSISKGELASLIRFGANAVFEGCADSQNGNTEMSEHELYNLLERQGRDLPAIYISNSNDGSGTSVTPEIVDELEKAQIALKDRMNLLKEVDLRQLGNIFYEKKKRKASGNSNSALLGLNDIDQMVDSNLMTEKRIRKSRVIMVDGKGTGYGGAVPVLAESMEKPEETNLFVKTLRRNRTWTHQTFCALCGKCPKSIDNVEKVVLQSKVADPPIKCAHCPLIFHQSCIISQLDNSRVSGMFICPHHRCTICNRSTAAAGGLLFRCIACVTSYCEDCLPQDEIESIGRCRKLEHLGYDSKQSYFIRCSYCCQLDGSKALGIFTDKKESANEKELEDKLKSRVSISSLVQLGSEDDNYNEVEDLFIESKETETTRVDDEVGEDVIIPLKSQLMRIHWEEILELPVVVRNEPKIKNNKEKTKNSKINIKPHKQASSLSEDDDEVEEEDLLTSVALLWRKSTTKSKKISQQTFSVIQAMSIFLKHSLWKVLISLYHSIGEGSVVNPSDTEINERNKTLFNSLHSKIESGRYRSAAQFINDIKYVLDSVVIKKLNSKLLKLSEKEKLKELTNLVMSTLDDEIKPYIVI